MFLNSIRHIRNQRFKGFYFSNLFSKYNKNQIRLINNHNNVDNINNKFNFQIRKIRKLNFTNKQINQILIKRNFSIKPGKKIAIFLEKIEIYYNKLKWVLIRSKRPFNLEDISAFISWLLTGNIVLFLIGTTTFFSLILMTINKFSNKDLVAEWLGNLITKNSNLIVSFESAISPNWNYGTIKLRNCKASKRPKIIKKIEKIEKSINGKILNKTIEEIYDDGNYTQFDLTIEEINISLSFWRWISGKGFINTANVKCIRGIIDRTHVIWKENDDPRNYKNFYKPGDWEIENFKIEDVLLTIYHPNGFRPCELSIYNADLDLFRKNWLMLDILTCNHLSGCYDGSLFTINKISNFDSFKEEIKIDSLVNKKLGRKKFSNNLFTNNNNNNNNEIFNKLTRFRIDNLKIEHLNKGMSGPFGWINKGTVDIIADLMILEENYSLNDIILNEGLNQFNKKFNNNNNNNNKKKEEFDNLFICDFYIRLKNPKASVPLFTTDLSYINNAAIRPIVGYINNNKTFIPIRGRIYKDLKDFDGSWTFYDSLFMDDLSESVYQGFYEYVIDERLRNERLRKVGFWSLQFMLQFILWSLTTLSG